MQKKSLHQIPVLDENGRVIRVYLRDDILTSETITNLIVFMAGGQGARLRPLTEDCPKPMLMVRNKPILEILFEQCLNSGFQNFISQSIILNNRLLIILAMVADGT